MKLRILTAVVLATGLFAIGAANAQQPAAPAGPPDLNAIPDKMPFATPYGTPITLERAQSVVQAGIAEATKRGWQMNVTVVDPNGDLIAFARMDGAQLASIQISQHKAITAVRFRRPTRVFEDAMQHGIPYVATLDGMIGSRGGIPLIEGGKIIGAVGCSGGTGSQDEAICTVASGVINK